MSSGDIDLEGASLGAASMPSIRSGPYTLSASFVLFGLAGCARRTATPAPVADAPAGSTAQAGGGGPRTGAPSDAGAHRTPAKGAVDAEADVASHADAWAAICGFRSRGVQFEESDGGFVEFYVDSEGHRTRMTDAGKDAGCRGWCSPHGAVTILHIEGADHDFEGTDIAVDATRVVWTEMPYVKWYPDAPDSKGPSVWAIAKTGGKEKVLASDLANGGLMTDSKGVYFHDHGNVIRIPEGGARPSPLAAGERDPFQIPVHDDAYSYEIAQPGTYDEAIVRRPLAGGAATTLAPSDRGELHIVIVDDTRVYWISTRHESRVFEEVVRSVGKNGGEVTTHATWPSCLQNPVAHGASLYFSTGSCGNGVSNLESGSGEILKVPLRGGAVTTLATIDVGQGTPRALAADDANVYWVDCNGNVLQVGAE